ncbi:MAG: acyl-CoA thioesterase [Clostridia bacterium]|nr:acyl-CoA thioesterase [Clostridia bacterium]
MSFTYIRKLNYYETDKMGVVHHSNYIRFLEEARSRWLEELGISMEFLESNGYTIPTLEVNCKYKHHVTSGDTIIIKPKITEFNGVRMTVSYEVTEQKTGKVVIEAWTKHCFTNRELRPINMKKKDETVNKIFEDLLNEGRS